MHFVNLNLTPLLAMLDEPAAWMLCVVLGVLVIAFGIGQVLRGQPETTVDPAVVQTFNHRIRAWWMMWAILAASFLSPWARETTVVFFGLISFWALREFITMTPTRRGDHRALFWTLLLFTPLQYVLVGIGRSFYDEMNGLDLYGVYSIMIPVYASLFIPARIALSGDPKRFLERSAKIQFGLLICVYSLSYAPALLDLHIVDAEGEPWRGQAGLLFYLVLIAQLSDVFQFSWDKAVGKHVIAPQINASKTWEGFLGSILSTTIVGMLLWKVTPFTFIGSACMALLISMMGFCGSMTMSATKRDRGVKDYGTLVQGHAGVLDRVDMLCFAAPVFYHVTRFFLTS